MSEADDIWTEEMKEALIKDLSREHEERVQLHLKTQDLEAEIKRLRDENTDLHKMMSAPVNMVMQENHDLKAENEMNKQAALNGTKKLAEANQRIVEFESIKESHLEIRRQLLDENEKLKAALETAKSENRWPDWY